MFSHEGTARSDRQNRVLAGYLAFVGGYVNSCGFVLIGNYTSHVTGNVGRVATRAAAQDYGAALAALSLVGAFFAGAFAGSTILESRALGHVSRSYALALALECSTLLVFVGTTGPSATRLQVGAALLSFAMGLQNALVTRLSGAVVRTTHLTGVVTDLGIETARWFRHRHSLSRAVGVHLVAGPNEAERPHHAKVLLLTTIASSFFVGALAGVFAAVRTSRYGMLLPSVAVALASAYALVSGRRHEDATGTHS
jgi:uncharacterized membrane protein YoaK (UPF0700 family)